MTCRRNYCCHSKRLCLPRGLLSIVWKRRDLPPRNFTHRRVLPFIIGRRGTVGILSSRPRESRKVIWRRWFCVRRIICAKLLRSKIRIRKSPNARIGQETQYCENQSCFYDTKRLLKNAHLRRCVSPCVVQRTPDVRLTTQASRALHLDIFEQPCILKGTMEKLSIITDFIPAGDQPQAIDQLT